MQINQTRSLARSITAALAAFMIAIVLAGHGKAQLDPTFGTDGVAVAHVGVSAGPRASFVLPDGKILVVTRTGCCGSPGNGTHFFRFNSDGTPDTTYSPTGYKQITIPFTIQGRPNAAARQSDGKIVIVGRHDSADSFVARFNEDGSLDTSFNGTGYHQLRIRQFDDDELLSVLIQPDGKILAAGYADVSPNNRLAIVRYLPNGTLDAGFLGAGIAVHDFVSLSDTIGDQFLYLNSAGKILVANPREMGGGKMRRFNSDGTFDGGFATVPYTSISGFDRTVSYVQADDKIIVSGVLRKTESLFRSHDDMVVFRYNADGTPDTGFGTAGSVSFDITSYFTDEPLGFEVMADGQIIVVVETDIFVNRSKMSGNILAYAKLSADGTVVGKYLATDEANSGTEPSFTHVLPDGKILTIFRRSGTILLTRLTGIPMQSYVFHAVPYNFPSAAAAVDSKPSVFNPNAGTFRVYPFSNVAFGVSGGIPVSGDFIGGLIPDFAFFRPSDGTWTITHGTSSSVSDILTVQWGLAGDVPAAADYDGDGKSDIAVFRPSDGVWYIRNSADDSYTIVQWGTNGDKPVQGDYDGDGRYDIGVFRPSDGIWYILRSSDGGVTIRQWGINGDIPVQEDYDGDGNFDIAVYRPSEGVWYRLSSSDGSFFIYPWGLPGDIPVPADYDRDKKTNIAVWRPSTGGWYIVNPDHVSMHQFNFGTAGEIPLPGRF